MAEDQVQLDKGFKTTIQCLNCQSTDCEIQNNVAMGSSRTGPYGEVEIVCKSCGQTEIVGHEDH